MAKVHHVAHAQQRYATVPVLDADGNQVRKEIERTTKHGRQVTVRETVSDKTQPLPNHACDRCRKEIHVGDPYKWIKPKSGPYGGRMRIRCAACPTWNVWEYSDSMDARLQQISWQFWLDLNSPEGPDDVQAALDSAASSVRDLAEEKRESAQNIEDGFGHATFKSDELNEIADSLDSWADEIESANIPDLPEGELTEDQMDEWRDEVSSEVTIVDECPV